MPGIALSTLHVRSLIYSLQRPHEIGITGRPYVTALYFSAFRRDCIFLQIEGSG